MLNKEATQKFAELAQGFCSTKNIENYWLSALKSFLLNDIALCLSVLIPYVSQTITNFCACDIAYSIFDINCFIKIR